MEQLSGQKIPNSPYSILMPPAYVFFNEARNIQEQVIVQENTGPILERLNLPETGGMELYYKDVPFPKKGFPYPDAIGAVNTVKRFSMIVTAFNTLNPRKLVERILANFCRFSDWVLNPHYLKTEFYSPCPRTLWELIAKILMNLKISQDTASRTGRVIATLIEYDDAYLYRIEDVFSATTQERMLKNPRKEIKKMMVLLKEREHSGLSEDSVGGKFLTIGKIIRILLLLPNVKKAFRKALAEIDFSKLQLDEADRYWCLTRGDYEFLGQPLQTRIIQYQKIMDGKQPEMIKVSLQFNH